MASEESAAERLRRLWSEGRRPDVVAFLGTAGSLPVEELAEVLRVDQRERWQTGERVPAEDYLRRHPNLAASPDAAVDLIYTEFLLREKLGDRPTAEEYARRFPTCASVLLRQIDLHRALEGEPDTHVGPTVDVSGSTLALPGEPVTVTPLPDMFGRYRILGPLGRGGMASVYLAHDTRLDRRVALKVPHFGPNASGPAVERFYREARIAAAFTHPNLCRVYDVGELNGLHYLTMPFIEGESLAAWLARDAPLASETAVRLALKIAEAMDVAHRAGVVHRDLKPGNVMVNERREPIVMDFGLARRGITIDPRLTASGAFVGTPGYSAPEQYAGDPDALGPACDVYALGVILREMRTGKPPTRRTHLDPRLEAIHRTATATDPKARYPSMAAFALALREYLQASRRTRRRTLVLACTVVAVVAVAVAAYALLPGSPPSAPTVSAEDPLRLGSRWVGQYQFAPPFEGVSGPVEVEITRRDGDQFWGTYRTDRGDYHLLIRGTARGGEVRWEFTEAVHEKEPRFMVGNARVDGRYDAEGMKVDFTHSVYRSKAKMTLWPAT